MREHYAEGTIDDTVRALEERFGMPYGRGCVYQKAAKMGLSKSGDWMIRAQQVVRWGDHPDWLAFVRDHDTGTRAQLAEAFEREFGVRITPAQVTAARNELGTAARRQWSGHPDGRTLPIGSTRDTGKGYTLVKVRERARVPGSKDNWVPRHVIAFERAYGPVPDGCEVVHADRDNSNDDPANLVAAPKSLVGIVNQMGIEYHDRESLETALAIARLKSRTRDLMCRPRECAVCGRTFTPPRASPNSRTCPDCVRAGRKYRGEPRQGQAVCARCGRTFVKRTRNQRLCRECSAQTNGRWKRGPGPRGGEEGKR